MELVEAGAVADLLECRLVARAVKAEHPGSWGTATSFGVKCAGSEMQLRRILVAISVASSCAALSLSAVAPRASASSNQISILQDDNQLQSNPGGTLANLRLLGAQVVKVTVSWDAIAPNPNSRRQPRGFHPANAAAYPPANWAIYDEIDRDAHADGMQVYLDLAGGGPRWAEGPGQPRRPSFTCRMGAIPKRVRSVCACGRSAVRREVYTGRRLDPPPPRELLVGMERAQPGRFPLSTRGAWRSLGREQQSPLPQPVGGRLGRPRSRPDTARTTFLIGELAPRGSKHWGVFQRG